jgi:hypothetical protein
VRGVCEFSECGNSVHDSTTSLERRNRKKKSYSAMNKRK